MTILSTIFMASNSFIRPLWIFFDLDDTVWDFKNNSMTSLRKLYEISPILKKYFKTFDELDVEYHIHNSYLWGALSRGEISGKDLKAERWRRTLQSKTFEVLTAVCEELDETYLNILATLPGVPPHTLSVMQRLSKDHLIGILSNGFPATQYKKMRSSGLDKYVTRLVVSEEIGKAKPDRALFEYAVAETGARYPHIMVGDNLEADVLGAINAGWFAIWFKPDNAMKNDTDKELPSDREIKMIICEKGGNPDLFLGRVRNLLEAEEIIQKMSHRQFL